MVKRSVSLALIAVSLISGAATAEDWKERVGKRFELTQKTWLDRETLASDPALASSGCNDTPRFNRSYEIVRSFFRDPKSFSDDVLMNTKTTESCECARWIVTKQRADWQDVLDYAGLPRCGPDSSRRQCLANDAASRACADGEDPYPYKKEVVGP